MNWINYDTYICNSEEQNFSIKQLCSNAICEEIAVKKGTPLFWEAHYFRLMACMRIMHMSIPLTFTPDFLLKEIKRTIEKNFFLEGITHFIFFEETGKIRFLIRTFSKKIIPFWDDRPCKMEIFTDYQIYADLLSTLLFVSNPKQELANLYISEHFLDEVIFLNQHKRLSQGTKGFVFLVKGRSLLTPKIEEGVQKSVLRTKFLEYIKKDKLYDVQEVELSVYELQKADEVFFLNSFSMRSVGHYRKKQYENACSQEIFKELQRRVALELY